MPEVYKIKLMELKEDKVKIKENIKKHMKYILMA